MAAKKQVQIEVKVDKDKAQKDLKTFGDSAKQQFGGIADAVKGFMAGAVVAAIGKAIEALIDFGKEASKFKGISDSFKSMSASMGQDSEALMDKMRSSTKGMISDLELMKNANIAMSKGLDLTQVEEMARIAAAASKATGQSMNETFALVLDGLAEQKGKILEQVGMSFDAAKALDVYAASLGKTADQLTIAEKNQGFLTAALKVGGAMADVVGSSKMLTFNQILEKSAAGMENLKARIGQAALPALTALANVFDKTIEKMKGSGVSTESMRSGFDAFGKVVAFIGGVIMGNISNIVAAFKSLGAIIEATANQALAGFRLALAVLKKDTIEAERQMMFLKNETNNVGKATTELATAVMDLATGSYRQGTQAVENYTEALRLQRIEESKPVPPPRTRIGDQNTNVSSGSSGNDDDEKKRFGTDIGKFVSEKIDTASGTDKKSGFAEGAGLGGGVVGMVGQVVDVVTSSYTTMLSAEAQFLAVRSQKIEYFADLFIGFAQKQKEMEIKAAEEKWAGILEKEREGFAALQTQIEENMTAQQEQINAAYNNQLITTEEKETKIVQAQKFAQEQKDKATKEHNKKMAQNEKDQNAEMKRLAEEKEAQDAAMRKQRAMITWIIQSAQLEAQKRIQLAQVTISTYSSAAQALGSSIAMLGPILGSVVGAGLAAQIIAAGQMSKAAIQSQVALPPADLFLAEGGIVMPRPGGVRATIAEAGQPEAVIPLDKMGAMGGVTINVQNLYATEDLPAKLVDMIDRELYMRARVGQSVFASEVSR